MKTVGESVHVIRTPGALLCLQYSSGHHLTFPPPHYHLEVTHRGQTFIVEWISRVYQHRQYPFFGTSYIREHKQIGAVVQYLRCLAVLHRLTEQLQALHFNVAIMAWAYEDERDRAVDLERMLTLLEEMEFNRRGDHNEVMIALEV